MLEGLQLFLAPPVFPDDEDKTRVASVLNTLLLGLMAGLVVIGVVTGFARLLNLLLSLALAFGVWLILRRGHVRLAALMIVVGLSILLALVVPMTGGVRAATYGGFIVVVLFAGIVLGWRAAVAAAAFATLLGAALLVAEAAGWWVAPPSTASPLTYWIVFAFYFFVPVIVLRLAWRLMEAALQRARAELAERRLVEQKLETSERRFRMLIEKSNSALVLVNAAGEIFYESPAAQHITGYMPAERVGANAFELVTPEHREALAAAFARLRQSPDRPVDVSASLRHRTGRTVWVEGVATNLLAEPAVGALVISFREVTAQRQAEMALRQSEELLRSAVSVANMGIFDHDQRTDTIYWSPRQREIHGWGPEEPIELPLFLELVHPDDREHISATVRQAHDPAGDGVWDVEHRIIRRDGSVRWLAAKSQTYFEGQGDARRPVRTVGAVLDITAQKEAAEALRTKSAELEALFDVAAALRAAKTADEILPLALGEIRRLVPVDGEAILLRDQDSAKLTVAMSQGLWEWPEGVVIASETAVVQQVLEARRPAAEALAFSGPTGSEPGSGGRPGERHRLYVPLQSEIEMLGLLVLDRLGEARPFSAAETRLLSALGEMVANALRRARLYDQALDHLAHLRSLHAIDTAITANLDLPVAFELILREVVMQLKAEAAAVLLLNPSTQELEIAYQQGFRGPALDRPPLPLGQGHAGQAALERRSVVSVDLVELRRSELRRLVEAEGFASYACAPMIAKGEVLGVLEVFRQQPVAPPADWLDFLATLATQAAIAVDNAFLLRDMHRANAELRRAYETTIEGWSRALDLREHETGQHSWRVTELTLRLAQALGMTNEALIHIRRGALLHDIGKMGVPDSILLKPGELTPEEWVIMRQHPQFAYEMLAPIEYLREALDIPYCHHERWDGTGYPRGLKGEEIPLAARIFAVCDVWDALLSDRPYRPAWPRAKALESIRAGAGRHFDPAVVELFVKAVG